MKSLELKLLFSISTRFHSHLLCSPTILSHSLHLPPSSPATSVCTCHHCRRSIASSP
ncbi:hypothetical protein Tsubulata_041797 [Turnera subulata]|uniref:Uncharacterized protein n=1 Tax=Turnera subulata TaxID=218843 RepID=A0A9Q0FZP1_9ROSI|nr:hypothetical protein Tsubulata_041797 [Turnera subulata]